MNATAVRKLHRTVAPWLVLPLAVTLLTGVTYRIGRAWFGLPQETGWKILDIHAGEWLGGVGSVIYVCLLALAVLFLAGTGIVIFRQSRSKNLVRRFHRLAGILLILPLFASAATGVAYRIGEEFSLISESTEDVLMDIHQGKWLGAGVVPYYILVLGLALGGILWTGLVLAGLFKKVPSVGRH